MALVFLHHFVGDLTLGKPEFVEFSETETLTAAVGAIAESPEGAIPVWRKRQPAAGPVAPSSSEYFVGMLNSLDVAAFIARAGRDHASAMRTPVSEVVVPNQSMLKEMDPSARLLDALEMMKNGARCLLVRKSLEWKGVTKRFSTLYNYKSFKISETTPTKTASSTSSSTPPHNNVCCLYREDVVRFLIGCLGALAPIPLSSISSIGAYNPHYSYVEASSSALEAISRTPHDPCAIAVVETNSDGSHKILGDISAEKLWKCDYMTAAWALANLSAGQFAVGIDENASSPIPPPRDPRIKSKVEPVSVAASPRSMKFSSRSVGFVNNQWNKVSMGRLTSMYRGRSKPLTCKDTGSLAAVMAQMLSHRANHIWVIDSESEDVLVGVVSYTDILDAVVKFPSILLPPTP